MKEKPQTDRTPEKNKPVEKKWAGSGFWLAMICLSSIWMFVFGVLVGRGTAPVQFDIEKLQKELIALKEAVIQKEKEHLDAYSQAVNDKAGLEFYEALKQPDAADAAKNIPGESLAKTTQSPVKTPGPGTAPQAKPGDPFKTALSVKTEPPVKTNPLPPTAQKELPVNPPPGSAKPAETDAGISKSRWAIQVASLKDSLAADKMVENLKQKGFSAYCFGANVSGKGIWHRVRVGPFNDKNDAEQTLFLLKKNNFNAILISL